jgi:hypothetical protein
MLQRIAETIKESFRVGLAFLLLAVLVSAGLSANLAYVNNGEIINLVVIAYFIFTFLAEFGLGIALSLGVKYGFIPFLYRFGGSIKIILRFIVGLVGFIILAPFYLVAQLILLALTFIPFILKMLWYWIVCLYMIFAEGLARFKAWRIRNKAEAKDRAVAREVENESRRAKQLAARQQKIKTDEQIRIDKITADNKVKAEKIKQQKELDDLKKDAKEGTSGWAKSKMTLPKK